MATAKSVRTCVHHGLMVKLTLLELPPAQSTCMDATPDEPEAVENVVGLISGGLKTKTFAVPGTATSEAEIAAIS